MINWSSRFFPSHISGPQWSKVWHTFFDESTEQQCWRDFSGHISMFQNSFQLDTMTLSSMSYRSCFHITISDNYKLWNLYSYVIRGVDMGSGTHRALLDVAATCEIPYHGPFWFNLSHHIKQLIVPYSWMRLVPR